MVALIYYFLTGFAWVSLRLVARWQVLGKERVPPRGPLIMVANHLSMTDPPIIAASLPRRVVYMAKIELFRSWMAPVVRGYGAFPVRRGQVDRDALRQAQVILGRGQVLGVFVEGGRSASGSLQSPFLGAALLALRTGSPVLPVAICGTEQLRGTGWFRRPRITVSIGEPVHPSRKEARLARGELQEFTQRLMEGIAALLPPQYRGSYGMEAPLVR